MRGYLNGVPAGGADGASFEWLTLDPSGFVADLATSRRSMQPLFTERVFGLCDFPWQAVGPRNKSAWFASKSRSGGVARVFETM